MASQVDTFLAGLNGDDPVERATALTHLPNDLLGDPDVLVAVLQLTRSSDPVPAKFQPTPEVDPFADFFGIQKEVVPLSWSGMALEKLSHGGPEGNAATIEAIASVLNDGPLTDDLCSAVCRLVGDVAWADERAAVIALLGPQAAAGRSLFEALPRLGLAGLDAVLGLALDPFTTRILNELFNHPHASNGAARALCRRIVQGELSLTEAQALEVLPLLAVWGKNDGNAAGGAMAVLEQAYPWASAFAAFENPKAAERFAAWCQAGEKGPEGFTPMLLRALRDRPDLVSRWPIEDFVRWADTDATVIEEWRVVPAHQELLTEWVQQLAETGERGARGWDAAGLLAEAGLHEHLVDTLADMLPGLPADAILVERLAAASPVIPGMPERLAELILEEPARLEPFKGAVEAAGVAEGFVDAYLAVCEAAPLERVPDAAEVPWLTPAGCTPEALEDFLKTDEQRERFELIRPREA